MKIAASILSGVWALDPAEVSGLLPLATSARIVSVVVEFEQQ